MSIQGLMQVKITSVFKKEEKPSDAVSAVFVMSGNNIPSSWPPCVEFSLAL